MNEQHFFTTLLGMLDGVKSIRLVITKEKDEGIVSIIPIADGIKDKAVNQLSPLVVRGTPEELDREFLTLIKKPLADSTTLFANLKNFEDGMATAKANSDMEKAVRDEERKAADKNKKEMEENDKKILQAIKEAETELKDKPYAAFNKLDELQKKTIKLSEKVRESLAAALANYKQFQNQTDLFK